MKCLFFSFFFLKEQSHKTSRNTSESISFAPPLNCRRSSLRCHIIRNRRSVVVLIPWQMKPRLMRHKPLLCCSGGQVALPVSACDVAGNEVTRRSARRARSPDPNLFPGRGVRVRACVRACMHACFSSSHPVFLFFLFKHFFFASALVSNSPMARICISIQLLSESVQPFFPPANAKRMQVCVCASAPVSERMCLCVCVCAFSFSFFPLLAYLVTSINFSA